MLVSASLIDWRRTRRDDDAMWYVLGAIPVAIVAFAFWRQWVFYDAKQTYARLLGELSRDPDNVEKRTRALAAGRRYAHIARQHVGQKGRAIFDEVALQNDLTARTGKSLPSQSPKSASRADELLKLASLHEKGLLSTEEFEREKARLLG